MENFTNTEGCLSKNELCPEYKEEIKKHPQWFNEMVQIVVESSANSAVVQRYGSSIKQRIVSYSGKDNEAGMLLKKSLKSIAEQKTNPDYEYQIMKQKEGFAAEVLESDYSNSERAIAGRNDKVLRYDDVGNVNDPLYDVVEIDSAGNIIDGSGAQMKFLGGNPKDCWKSLKSGRCQKYVDNNVEIKVPSDFYDGVISSANENIRKLQSQYEKLLSMGETAKAEIKKQQIDYLEKTKKLIKKSKVSTADTEQAVKNPEKLTSKNILQDARRAGLEGAARGAAIGATISIVRNAVLLKNGEIEASEAIKKVSIDTAVGGFGGFVVGGGGAILKGNMQNSVNATVRNLSKTSIPAGAVGLAYGVTVSGVTNFVKWKKGEITKKEMQESIGKDSVKAGLMTCSLAMIAFPGGALEVIVSTGVALYLDAVCTNLLDEVFGKGAYEQILNASSYVTNSAWNIEDMLKAFEKNIDSIDKNLHTAKAIRQETQNIVSDTNRNIDFLKNKMMRR